MGSKVNKEIQIEDDEESFDEEIDELSLDE
jgi:hypothetical protein